MNNKSTATSTIMAKNRQLLNTITPILCATTINRLVNDRQKMAAAAAASNINNFHINHHQDNNHYANTSQQQQSNNCRHRRLNHHHHQNLDSSVFGMDKTSVFTRQDSNSRSNDERNVHGNHSQYQQQQRPPPPPPPPSSSSQSHCSQQNQQQIEHEMIQMVRYLMYRQEVDDNIGRRIHEWRLLSMYIDKILFWIFTITTVVTSIIFLLIIPVKRRGF
mgnify:CR=1 FL=1